MKTWTKRLLIVLEIGGGFLGLAMIAQSLWSVDVTPISVILSAIFAGLYLLGIVAGLAIVEKPALGLRLSLVYQALQIPMLASPFFTYILTSGSMVGVIFQVVDGEFNHGADFHFGSQFQFYLLPDVPWAVGINIVAVALLLAVRRAMKEQAELEEGQLSSESALIDEVLS